MSKFSYKAVDKSGEHITGTLDAADRKSAVAVLTGQGHFVTELSESSKAASNKESVIPAIDFDWLMKDAGFNPAIGGHFADVA